MYRRNWIGEVKINQYIERDLSSIGCKIPLPLITQLRSDLEYVPSIRKDWKKIVAHASKEVRFIQKGMASFARKLWVTPSSIGARRHRRAKKNIFMNKKLHLQTTTHRWIMINKSRKSTNLRLQSAQTNTGPIINSFETVLTTVQRMITNCTKTGRTKRRIITIWKQCAIRWI